MDGKQRTVVIEQPNFIPWLGYFDLIRQSDVFVWYDDVQYTKRDWRNRNHVAGDGQATRLTIPVKTKGRREQLICSVEIDYSQPWERKHLETLRSLYGRAPFFDVTYDVIRKAVEARPALLADLTIGLNEGLCALLGFVRTFVRSSQLPPMVAGRQERLMQLCSDEGGGVYLSGPAARAYLDPAPFGKAGIELRYIVYDYPPYERGGPFMPNLSIVDALAWLGPEGTAAFLGQHGRSEVEPIAC